MQERTNWFLPGISDRCLALFRLRFLLLKIFTGILFDTINRPIVEYPKVKNTESRGVFVDQAKMDSLRRGIPSEPEQEKA